MVNTSSKVFHGFEQLYAKLDETCKELLNRFAVTAFSI